VGYQGPAALECGVPGDLVVLLPRCAAFLRDLVA